MIADKGDKTATTRSLWWIPAGIFCCALLVRLIFLAENLNNPFFNYRGIDARAYHWMAAGLLDGTWPGEKTFFWPPLYPLFLGLLYKTIGQSATVVRMIQAVLGSLSCVLVYFIARVIFNSRFVPIAAALICCLCGTLVYFDVQLLPANLDVLLELLIIFFLLFALRHRQAIWWGAAGLFVGLSAINRGTILLFIPIILLWIYMVSRYRWGIEGESERPVFWRATIALLLPVGLIIFPVVLHNIRCDSAMVDKEPKPTGLKQFVSTGFLPIASYLGINFYLGNHLEIYRVNNFEYPDFFAIYKRIENEPVEKGIKNSFGQSQYLVRQTIGHIIEKPSDFIKLMGLKIFELFNGAEVPRNTNPYAFRQHSVLLSVLLWKKIIAFPSGLIIPFGLVGIFLSRDLWRKYFLLLGCLAVQYLLILAIFVTARYRLPTIPLLAIYAACVPEAFIRYAKAGSKGKMVIPAVLLAALMLFSNSFTGKMDANYGYSEYINLGNTLRAEGKTDEAISYYEEALKLAPNFPEAHINIGNVFARKGEIDQAIIHYNKALQYSTDNFDAHCNLATVLAQQGKNNEAVEHYAAALKLKPDAPEVHYDLANVLATEGKVDEAIAHYEEALNLKPDFNEARDSLANVLAEHGRLLEASRHWQHLVHLNPQNWMLQCNLGVAYSHLGQVDGAIIHLEEALRLKPDDIRVINNLAWLLATCEDPNYRAPVPAVVLAERGCKLTAYKDPRLLDTLAVAYAGTERFDEAVGIAERALELAKSSGQKQLAENISRRLELYKQKQAYHNPDSRKIEANS